MQRLNIRRMGLALGSAFALTYLGCAFVMLTVPKDAAIRFFNSIMHGINVEPIMRWDMPWWEMIIGVLEVFILGWLFGGVVGYFYNLGGSRSD